jgi:hypothetical protein
MNDNNTKIIKLSNGEDIVCTCIENKNTEDSQVLHISQPLRMEIRNKITQKGVVEALTLSRWLKPFSQADDFHLAKSNIVTITDASYALNNYYNFMLNAHKNIEDKNVPEEEKTRLEARFDSSIPEDEQDMANEEIQAMYDRYVKKESSDIKIEQKIKEQKIMSDEELDILPTSKTIH